MKKKSLLVALLIFSGFIIGYMNSMLVYLQKSSANITETVLIGSNTTTSQNNKIPPEFITQINSNDHIRGNPDAKIVLIEYSDLECPNCKEFHATAKSVLKKFDGEVAWVYRHYPIQGSHPNAQRAAESSECAAKLGGDDAFWAFIDGVFETDYSLDEDALSSLASSIGLNSDEFNKCVDSSEMKVTVDAMYNLGKRSGVSGTPNIIVTNTKTKEATIIRGAASEDTLTRAIESLL